MLLLRLSQPATNMHKHKHIYANTLRNAWRTGVSWAETWWAVCQAAMSNSYPSCLDRCLRLKPDENYIVKKKKKHCLRIQESAHYSVRHPTLNTNKAKCAFKASTVCLSSSSVPLFFSPFQAQFQGTLLPTLESFIMPPQNKNWLFTLKCIQ